MNTETKVFLRRRFKEYYWRHRVKAPAEVQRREFGVGTLEDKIKFRHKGFKTENDLNQYLKTEAPYYISYSSAYYEFPENQPMERKNWLGADLVFDLDRPMKYLSRRELEGVREEAGNLVGFLRDDFGFADDEIKVNFSGSKGYHIHVVSEGVRQLNGEARREIVDYLTGTGLDIRYFIREDQDSPVGLSYRRGKVKLDAGGGVGPKEGGRGWGGRIYAVMKRILESTPEDMKAAYGLKPGEIGKISRNRERYLELLGKGKWENIGGLYDKLVKRVVEEYAVRDLEDTDKQVTLDTSRLIRLPDTIHGGSGLLARSVSSLDSFNPLVEAVAFDGGAVDVEVSGEVGVFELMENRYGPFKAGERVKLEECAAVYLMLRDQAEAG